MGERLLPSAEPTRWAGAEEKLTITEGVISLAVSMLGTGIVAFPYGFSLCGYVIGPGALVVLGILAHLSYVSLIRCTACEHVASYGGLLTKLPKMWGQYTNIALWALLILATTAYVLISADIIRSVVLQGSTDVPEALHNHILFAIILVVVLPLCLLKSLHGLALISSYCSFAIVAVVCLIVWKCVQIFIEDPPVGHAPTATTQPHNVLLAVPVFSCAMFGHMNMAQIYAELKPEAKPRAYLVSLGACLSTVLLYMAVGGVGYAAFGRASLADVVAQIAAKRGEVWDVALMQGLLASFIVLKTPLLILPLRTLSVAIVSPAADPNALSMSKHVLLTMMLLVCVYLAAVAIPDLDKLLELLGALCVVPLCFVVPARLAWTLEVPRPVVKCLVLAIFGVLASVLSLVAVVKA